MPVPEAEAQEQEEADADLLRALHRYAAAHGFVSLGREANSVRVMRDAVHVRDGELFLNLDVQLTYRR